MDDYSLHVFAGGNHLAVLGFDPTTEQFSLGYTHEWVNSRRAFALSPHLPLSGEFSSASIRRFIENLLPEGRALDVASVHSNIQKNNIFGLIRQLGRETAGALSFLPVDQQPPAMEPVQAGLGGQHAAAG